MGFDLYGMNPYNPNKAIKPEMDWDSQPTREEQLINTLKKKVNIKTRLSAITFVLTFGGGDL